jgi:Tol biopolymer transport system component
MGGQDAKQQLLGLNINGAVVSVIVEREYDGQLEVLVQTRWKKGKIIRGRTCVASVILPILLLLIACSTPRATTTALSVPQGERWGIYRLDIDSQELELLFDSPTELSFLCLNNAGDRVAFSQKVGGDANRYEEIFALDTDGRNLHRLTDNDFWDLYPAWSPDDARIMFLSQRSSSLGIYVVNADGSDQEEAFDSASHEADIDWVGDLVAFTRDSRIWIMRSDGSEARPLTDLPRAGEWGAANLPFGDYDPRISPDGSKVVFERLLGDESPHGNYDIFLLDLETSQESRLTHSGYSQGLASWSHSGQQIVYVVAAIDGVGQYDLYVMNADGTDNRNVTPGYFPPQFLCHWAVFSGDDAAILFVGEWWPDD